MKKTFKWSVLLTLVLGLVWLFVMPNFLKQSPLIDFDLFGHNLNSRVIISRFWDLLTIIPICLLIYLLTKNDEGFNPGITILAFISLLTLLFTFEIATKSWVIYIFGVYSLIAYLMATQDLDHRENKATRITKRLLISVLTTLLVTSLVFGILNGIIMAAIFSAIYLLFGIILIFSIGFFKFLIKLPINLKNFLNWMNQS